MPYPRILVLILNWKRKDDTKRCLLSLQKITSCPFTPLVLDNGSEDGTMEMVEKEFPGTPCLQNGENLGFAEGNNRGLRWGLQKKYDWFFLLNNDAIVDPEILSSFLQAHREDPSRKILGAKLYSLENPRKLEHAGGYWSEEKGNFFSYGQGAIDDGVSFCTTREVDYACGAALFVHRDVFETVGLFEPKFFLFWEEVDFCTRAKRGGFSTWFVPNAKVWHALSSSFTGGKPHTHYFWWRNRLLWIERNCSPSQKKDLYKRVIVPEIKKLLRHYLLKALMRKSPEKRALAKAGLWGIFHFFRGKFGNCPATLARRKEDVVYIEKR